VLDMACGIPSHLGNPAINHHETLVDNAIYAITASKEAITETLIARLILSNLVFVL
jgi:hypothetical protein